jgi:hypothetical protein
VFHRQVIAIKKGLAEANERMAQAVVNKDFVVKQVIPSTLGSGKRKVDIILDGPNQERETISFYWNHPAFSKIMSLVMADKVSFQFIKRSGSEQIGVSRYLFPVIGK